MPLAKLQAALRAAARPAHAAVAQSFFKTGPGEYGEGDVFLGVRVPAIRALAKSGDDLSLAEVRRLLHARFHEERLLGLLLLVRRFEQGGEPERRVIFELYLSETRRINNWDLVDLSAPNIVGAWLRRRPRGLLRRLARSASLWERRIAILATLAFIRADDFADTIAICEILLRDPHDLIHKATGWMLREVGKRDAAALRGFLAAHAPAMPRTMLRNAIERLPEQERQRWLTVQPALPLRSSGFHQRSNSGFQPDEVGRASGPSVPTSNPCIPLAQTLRAAVASLRFDPPVAFVYNPLDYAWGAHEQWLRRFATGRKRVIILGMNPGPFGMAQTGVPFGEVTAVRDWLGIHADIARPRVEHPRRPIEGFACARSEVSGRRLWGLFAARFGTAKDFFADHFVVNYCPLAFLSDSGANITPDKLPAERTAPLFAACDAHLRGVVAALEAEWVIGVGAFARARAAAVLANGKVRVAQILHPSPASPAANRDWAGQATRQLRALGLWN